MRRNVVLLRSLVLALFACSLFLAAIPASAATGSDAPACSKSLRRKYLAALSKLGSTSVTRELANANLNAERPLGEKRLGFLAAAKSTALAGTSQVPEDYRADTAEQISDYFDNLTDKMTSLNESRLDKFESAFERADTKYQTVLDAMADYSACVNSR